MLAPYKSDVERPDRRDMEDAESDSSGQEAFSEAL